MFKKFNQLEKSWIFYDIGNSAFTMLVTTLIPIWFNALASQAGFSQTQYLAFWSYATSAATIIVALSGPIFGTIADNKGRKKPMFTFVLFVGVIGCLLLGVIPNWFLFLLTYVIAKVCYQLSLVFYDSMLTDVTTPERMDSVSSQGYAWGYIGSCIPFLAALIFYLLGDADGIGFQILPDSLSKFFGFAIIGVWWFCVTIPLLKNYKQIHYVENVGNVFAASFRSLAKTLKHIVTEDKKIGFFLLAFFFYIDGVYTIIDEAVAIGQALGLNTVGLLIILLLTQVVAFVFATIFGKLSEKYETTSLIKVCIFGYIFVALFALTMHALWQFGIMAFVVGMFQGAVQALSRSYYAQIIPAENSGEYFGLYDICGKGAAFLGTTLIGITVSITNSINVAVSALAILFFLGLFFLRLAVKENTSISKGNS